MNIIELLKTYPKHSQPRPSGMTYGAPPPGAGSPPPPPPPAQQSTPSGNATQQTNPTVVNTPPPVTITANPGNTGGTPAVVANNNNPSPPQATNTYDSVTWAGQIPYIEKGILYKQGQPLLGRRDDAGNLMFYSSVSGSITVAVGKGVDSSLSNKLHIEGVTENIDLGSFLETKKTNFDYFKFPANIKLNALPITIPEIDDVVIDIEEGTTPFYVRLKPESNEEDFGEIATAAGLNMNTLVYGEPNMVEANAIKITPEFKQTGNPLRIQGKISHGNNSSNANTHYLYLMKFSAGDIDREYKRIYELPHEENTDDNNVTWDGENQQSWDSSIYSNSTGMPDAGGGLTSGYVTKNAFFEFILQPNEFVTGDKFCIGIKTGNANNTYRGATSFLIGADATLTQHQDDGRPIDHWRLFGSTYRDRNGQVLNTPYPPLGD